MFLANVIFIPVNDKKLLESFEGGSHWSLLVYVKKNNKFLYYDSSNNYNFTVANKFATKISSILEVESKLNLMKKWENVI